MFNSGILDVAIGIVFVFVLVSTLCSTIREGLEAWLRTRSSYLEYAIRDLLHDRKGEGLAKQFFYHPLICSLYHGDYSPGGDANGPKATHHLGNLPSYIPSKSFALALMDLAAHGPQDQNLSSARAPMTLDALRANAARIENTSVQRVLLAAIDSAQGDLDKAQAYLEAWYDSAMERVSGWYKRYTQKLIFVIALVVVAGLNINVITIADSLYRNQTLRDATVAAVKNQKAAPDASATLAALDALHLPVGWSDGWGAPKGRTDHHPLLFWNDVFGPLLGLLVTALGATLGAPFWFDILNRFVTLRASLKPASASSSSTAAEPSAPATTALATPSVAPLHAHEADGCEGTVENPMPDDELPAAVGGVA